MNKAYETAQILNDRSHSFIYKGAPRARCNGGLRPPHARQIYEIKLPVKIVQGATRTTRSDFLPSATFAVALSYNFLQ